MPIKTTIRTDILIRVGKNCWRSENIAQFSSNLCRHAYSSSLTPYMDIFFSVYQITTLLSVAITTAMLGIVTCYHIILIENSFSYHRLFSEFWYLIYKGSYGAKTLGLCYFRIGVPHYSRDICTQASFVWILYQKFLTF